MDKHFIKVCKTGLLIGNNMTPLVVSQIKQHRTSYDLHFLEYYNRKAFDMNYDLRSL